MYRCNDVLLYCLLLYCHTAVLMYCLLVPQVKVPGILASVAPKQRWGFFAMLNRLMPVSAQHPRGGPTKAPQSTADRRPVEPRTSAAQKVGDGKEGGSDGAASTTAAAAAAVPKPPACTPTKLSAPLTASLPGQSPRNRAYYYGNATSRHHSNPLSSVEMDALGLPSETWYSILQRRKKEQYSLKLAAILKAKQEFYQQHQAAKTIQVKRTAEMLECGVRTTSVASSMLYN